ncbi:hypothetical protein FQ087_12350 [Sporosarcina sp. ANT_H38]|uniref:hypothetical protein n=1 Tax=Sporosarcina sp. ANT_H38 TaxID=2597358 RepID=UPI0011F31513|nr:hypothetical protein [Sporosarcina sp. ANT_H38]KAA0955406.1 hypothetical protein FQ087_12350 [Sporosarcina sp. ANT_H38]
MKKNILTYIIYALLAVGTITTLFIVYKDIDSSYSLAFVIGYIIFLFLSAFYFMIAVIINVRKLKWIEIRKRLYKFIAYFVLLSGFPYIADYIFKSLEFDLYNIVTISLGLSFGIVFLDLVFYKEKNG